MRIGDKVSRVPLTFTSAEPGLHEHTKRKTGTVVYIHPKGRYHIVEFQTRGGPVREAFMGVEK